MGLGLGLDNEKINNVDKSSSKSPFFSVCIPVYNTEKYLDYCITSILNQSEKDFEIILVDDGSTDKSGSICDKYADAYDFIHALHKSNEGPLIARTTAVLHSKGEYLLFLDADDFFLPDSLKKIRNQIQNYQADMVFFDLERLYEDGHVERQSEDYKENSVFEGESKYPLYMEITTESKLNAAFRKCIHRNIYLDSPDYSELKGLIQAEDKLISLGWFDRAQKIVYLKNVLYVYRINPSGTSNNITLKNYKDVCTVSEYVKKYIEIWGLPEQSIVEYGQHILNSALTCLESLIKRIYSQKSNAEELNEAIDFIENDKYFRNSFIETGKSLRWYNRIACKLIYERKTRSAICFMRLKTNCKKIRNAVFQIRQN